MCGNVSETLMLPLQMGQRVKDLGLKIFTLSYAHVLTSERKCDKMGAMRARVSCQPHSNLALSNKVAYTSTIRTVASTRILKCRCLLCLKIEQFCCQLLCRAIFEQEPFL